jgi:prephenate dehydrogenase
MTTQITVLGLGQIGTSIGLALAGNKATVIRTGNDRDNSIARASERIGAFDKIVVNLHSAVDSADLVILALPVGEIEDTLKVISEDLRPGVVVIDTSAVKVVVTESAQKILGPDRYFVTMSSGLNAAYLEEGQTGPEAAHADLFKDSSMVITAPPGTHPGAIQLASDLATMMGGVPFFVDPYEADGLAASINALPLLAAAALVHATQDQPGWREARKLAGKAYAQGTRPAEMLSGKNSYGAEATFNRDNVMRVLDDMIANLREVREMVAQGETEALHQYLSQAQESRELWLRQRARADWEARSSNPSIGMNDILGRLVGLKPKKDKK